MRAIGRLQCAARQTARVGGAAAGLTAALGVALTLALSLTGCATPGAPQPPSLNLPRPVTNLAAVRAGDRVTLTWTMPTRNTDKLALKGDLTVKICREQGGTTCGGANSAVGTAGCSACGRCSGPDFSADGSCAELPAVLSFAPGAEGTFTEPLPAALAAGPPRLLRYFVAVYNRNGRSAGVSNAAEVLAGTAPAAVTGLRAEVRKDGVVLRWNPAVGEAFPAAIRLHRTLLTPQTAKPRAGVLAPPPEAVEQNLLVESCAPAGSKGRCYEPDRALDKSIRFGQSYEYRAQRVERVVVGGKALELDGALSMPVGVAVLDVFPPAVPTGLAAVATEEKNGAGRPDSYAIDLNWQPVADANLAGYIVYRSESGTDWRRVSPAEPLAAPAFHDSDVQPGHTYRYAVSAIAQNGHESARSAVAEETVPGA